MPDINPFPGNTEWPTEWQGSRLTGRYLDTTGAPVVGEVIFKPSFGAVIAAASKAIVVGASLSVSLNEHGAFDIFLPATNDPDLNPTGFTYLVTEKFSGGRTYSIDAPANATRDLTAVAPVTAANGTALVRGASAYEIAVLHGFSGSEAEWLDSIGSGGGEYSVDATTTGKGRIQLANHLGGTADAPTVPGLADRVKYTEISELAQDMIGGGFVVGGNGIATAYDDVANTFTISAVSEYIRDVVAAMIVAGTNASVVYDDNADTLTIASTGGSSSIDAEQVRDIVAAMVRSSGGQSIVYDDNADTLTFTAPAAVDAEFVQDTVAAMLRSGTTGPVTAVYDDNANTLTLSALGDPETIRDTIAAALVASGYIAITVDDPGNTITIGTTAAFATLLTGLAPKESPTFTGTFTVPDGTIAQVAINGLATSFSAKAPKLNPTFTGTVVVPTAVTATAPPTKQQLDDAIASFGNVYDAYVLAGASASTGTDTAWSNVAGLVLDFGTSPKARYIQISGQARFTASLTGDYRGRFTFTGAGIDFALGAVNLATGATVASGSARQDKQEPDDTGFFQCAGLGIGTDLVASYVGELYIPAAVACTMQYQHSQASVPTSGDAGTSAVTKALSSLHGVVCKAV